MVKRTLWTPSSWECYKNNCECSEKCSNYKECQYIASQMADKKPPIKRAVMELIESGVAIPIAVTDYEVNCLSDEMVETLKYWLLDGLTREEIAKKMGITDRAVQEKIIAIMRPYEYAYAYKCPAKKAEAFEVWAKANLLPELEELEKVGVGC